MNYYAITEKYLYNYNSLKASVKNMETQIRELDYSYVKAKNYEYIDDTGYRDSSVENKVIKLDEKREKLNEKIMELENKLERIDRAIEALNEVEQLVIKERYFEGRQWWIIAYKLKYSERWCKELRRRAVYKIAIGLWGEDVIHKQFTNTSPQSNANGI